jgi:hypothetical protein
MKIELRHIPDCPYLEQARRLLKDCLDELGLQNLDVIDREGDFPSPSILVDAVDVMGAPGGAGAVCRLDVPTREHILSALRRR